MSGSLAETFDNDGKPSGAYVRSADYDELERQNAELLADGRAIPVPVDALLWLFGMGDSFSPEGKRGAFWWRSEFMERAGLTHEQLLRASELGEFDEAHDHA